MPDFSVDGRNAIVTGASQGIGQGVAESLAAEGANVSICSRSIDRVGPVAERIEADGGTAFAMECDVRDPERVEAYVEATIDEFGGVDLLVNNAGGQFRAPFEEISENGWEAIVDLNLNSVRHTSHAAGAHMREHGGGDIINFSSLRAQIPSWERTPYAASKAAIINFTENLALEWAEHDVAVNCVAPGLIHTPGVEETLGLGEESVPSRDTVDRRLGTVEDIAGVVQFLASDAAAFMTGETVTAKGTPRATPHDIEDEIGL
jgi:NAD(P)-dependent dehydrogenase (short-subunit alcohol dehydrogenase family)